MNYIETNIDKSNNKYCSVVCPKCGRETAFEPGRDAIDEDGEVYRCRQCGWPFWWRGKSVVERSDKF